MESDSRTLLQEFVRLGDRAALGRLLEELRPYVRVLVRSLRRGRPTSDDSDLIQESLMQAAQSAGKFRGATLEEWVGWLRAITVRTTYRKLNAAHELQVDLTDAELATLVLDTKGDPQAEAQRHENAARIAQALSRLPQDMQAVLMGRLIDGLDHQELAFRLGRNPGAVRMLYLRALRRLRDIWQTEFSSERRGSP